MTSESIASEEWGCFAYRSDMETKMISVNEYHARRAVVLFFACISGISAVATAVVPAIVAA